MTTFTVPAKEFKHFRDPYDPQKGSGRPDKYRFYVNVNDVPEELKDWMDTNPRDQNLDTNVARAIRDSLLEDNKSFHLWNRGILLSASRVVYDNRSGLARITFEDPEIHGDIDGGHTLKVILTQREKQRDRGKTLPEQYVEFEVIVGVTSPEDLAEARNNSVAVNTKSLEELKDSFGPLKEIFNSHTIQGNHYVERIEFRQNQMRGKSNAIDIREVIGILNMFNQELYPNSDMELAPIQSFSGREACLRRFLQMGLDDDADEAECRRKRDQVVADMRPIIPDILELWDYIECHFTEGTSAIAKRYGAKAYSNYDAKSRPNALFSDAELRYSIPRGILYPVVGSFRALVRVHPDGSYYWALPPIQAWKDLSGKIAELVMSSSQELGNSPTAIGKSKNLWNSLFLTLSFHAQKTERA